MDNSSGVHATKEKQFGQIDFAVKATSSFLKAVTESSSFDASKSQEIKQDLSSLLKQLSDQTSNPQELSEKLNQCILKINETLSENAAKYPEFSLNGPLSRIQSMNQILAFEQFLGEALKTKDLPFSQESPLFKEAYFLWQKVSSGDIKSDQAMAKLADIIKEVNKALSEKDQYPLPDLSAYS